MDTPALTPRALAVLPAMATNLERVRETGEPEQERVAAVEQSVAHLDQRLSELGGTLWALAGEVHDAAEYLPDPDALAPLARLRDARAGSA